MGGDIASKAKPMKRSFRIDEADRTHALALPGDRRRRMQSCEELDNGGSCKGEFIVTAGHEFSHSYRPGRRKAGAAVISHST